LELLKVNNANIFKDWKKILSENEFEIIVNEKNVILEDVEKYESKEERRF
jgi:hypothetical protein